MGFFFVGLAKVYYSKPALSIQDQIGLLQSRGLSIPIVQQAEHYLTHINFYRLRAYWLPFEDVADQTQHRFLTGTSFEDVINLYTFDRKLRLLVLDAIERLEVSFRTQWAQQLAQQAGAHAYLNLTLFSGLQAEVLQEIRQEIQRSKETFIQHYRKTYSTPSDPPIWAACELMTLGQLSKSYKNIKAVSLRDSIAKNYQLNERVLASVMEHLNYIRNLCAHHNRLWIRDFTITLSLPRSKPIGLLQNFDSTTDAQGNPSNRKIYNTLVMMLYLLDTISPGSSWESRFKDLLSEHSINPIDMGFPRDWSQRQLWLKGKL